MPELPEVETTRRGIAPHLKHQTITDVIIRQYQLRWPIPKTLRKNIHQQTVRDIKRRGKYILIYFDNGTLILHLGMSGSLHIVDIDTPCQKHDHLDLIINQQCILRLRDPRRFGAVLWTRKPVAQHKLLKDLGPEPLENIFTAQHLYEASRKRKVSIKQFIMNSHIVVGVGNIYASEALFIAGIHPKRAAGKISLPRYQQLVTAIKNVLTAAIKQGGTTLRDFSNSDGKPGYFKQQLNVYGRKDKACPTCNKAITQSIIGQRSTFYCTHCQK